MEKHTQMLKSNKKQLNNEYIPTSRAYTFIFSKFNVGPERYI